MDADLTLAWVRAEIAPLAAKLQPPLPDANSTWSICEFLRDGRALCLLSAALDHVATKQQNDDDDDAHDIGDSTLPKNLQRSLHQLSTFHALERIQYFIKWCRNAPLDAYLVFSSVQLLDELNEKIVCTCLNALRDKFRPELRAKYNDLMAAKAAVASDHAEVVADKKAADDAAAADPAVVSDEDDDANETKAKDNNAEAEEEHDIPATPVKATRLTSAPSTPLPQPKSANKLSAFLSKFPSETNVLTTVETAIEVAVDAPKVPEEVVEEHDDDDEEVHEYDHNDEIHEKAVDNEVEAVAKDENVAEEIGQVATEKPLEDSDDEDFEEPSLEEASQDQTQPRYTSAFSPRSSISSSKRSSRVSSVSFSFTSRKDSFSEDRSRNQSFSSVVSSPPTSPKAVAAASRLRIPSIFEKNATGKKSESSGSTGAATDRSSSTSSHASSTKEDTKKSVASVPSEEPTTAPKAVSRLEIPNVFSQGRANTEASATTVATLAVEASPAPKPRPVSKLQIPSAFAASSGGAAAPASASSSAPAVATAAAGSVVEEVVPTTTAEATPVPEASPKPVSKLNIPAAFVRSTSTTSVERSPAVKSAVPESPFSAVTPELKKKPSRLKIPSVFGASSSHDTPPSPKRSEPETQTIEVATASTASTDVEPAIEAASAVAEIDLAVLDASPVSVEATPAPIVFASPKAEAVQSPVSRPSPIAKPASKLAAFLSTVVVANVLVPPASEETDGKIDESASEDLSFEPRFSENQETKIGLPCDSQEPATSDDSAAAQEESFEKVSVENIEIEDSDNSDDDAVRDQFADERLSDDLFSEQVPQESSSETVALDAEVHAVSEELLGDYVEVEQHNFDNHDHADGEQPFFVVEEVSLSKPSANSKLFAFLSSVDSAHPHPSSHTSEADEAEKADSVGSAPSRHSGSRKSALSPKRSVEDASEHSERSARTSMTAISLAVSSEVILEKERLSGENLALSQKLKTVEESLSAKESEFASLKAELEALKQQLAAEQAKSEAKLKTVVEGHETLVSKIRADHLKEITVARAAAHDDVLVEKQNQSYVLKIAALEEQNKALEQQLQIAKDSEEAARYSAQLAFAARDEAEALLRSQ